MTSTPASINFSVSRAASALVVMVIPPNWLVMRPPERVIHAAHRQTWARCLTSVNPVAHVETHLQRRTEIDSRGDAGHSSWFAEIAMTRLSMASPPCCSIQENQRP